MAISSVQQLAALQYPWHTKRARGRPFKMLRVSTPCSGSLVSGQRQGSPVNKEEIRKQVVGLVARTGVDSNNEIERIDLSPKSHIPHLSGNFRRQMTNVAVNNSHSTSEKFQRFSNKGEIEKSSFPVNTAVNGDTMPQSESKEALRNAIRRTKTGVNMDHKPTPKIVRFKMEDFTIGKQKTSIVKITDVNGHKESGIDKSDTVQPYEIKGNAISLRKEGLKGLLAYKDLCTENEKRQNSLQTSLKIFRRRIKLNQENFIQPNESTNEDYTVHPTSPYPDLLSTALMEENTASRPMSSVDHVRILRSALQSKRKGGLITRHTDAMDNEETTKNIKCSYRLPDNPNWGKEVHFKDIKDEIIPNVKTYVLENDKTKSRLKKGNVDNSVTLTLHNLGVHNSITTVDEKKVKLGDSEVGFDPRVLDWLEDSYLNSKQYRNAPFPIDDLPESVTSSKRKSSAKS